jgi:hypothetical protein
MSEHFNIPPRLYEGGHGPAYCSPWCGFDCTKAAFDRATTEAAALAARMGPGWEPRVWENGGWNYDVHKGVAVIHTSMVCGSRLIGNWTVGGYTAWINAPGIQFINSAETPEDALGISKQQARTHVAKLNDALDDILEDE